MAYSYTGTGYLSNAVTTDTGRKAYLFQGGTGYVSDSVYIATGVKIYGSYLKSSDNLIYADPFDIGNWGDLTMTWESITNNWE